MVLRSSDPNLFDEIDGIVINEQTPPSQIQGVGSNTAILVGQFQRGPKELSLPIASIGSFQEIYGRSDFPGNKQLRNKTFGRLRIIRVVSSGAAKATKDLGTRVTLTAKNEGAYGNNIYGTVTSQGATFTLVVEDKNPRAILPIETYTNLTTDNLVSETAGSKLVDVTLRGNNGNQAAVNETKLSGGSDGTVADTDYEAALTQAEAINAGNVLFLDVNNAIRNGYLKNHAAAQQDKMVIVAGGENDTIAQTVNAVGSLRDTDGRIIYAYPWVQTVINGTLEFTNPSAWIASVFSQIPSHVALSRVQNSQFLGGTTPKTLEAPRPN